MMARSTTRSNQRPDTLMQDRSPPARQNLLATHGRTIHWVRLRRTQYEHMFSALLSNSDIARCSRHVSKVANSRHRAVPMNRPGPPNGASSGRLHAIQLLVGIQQRRRHCEAEYLRDPLPTFNNIAASRLLSRDLLQCVEACLLLGGQAGVEVVQRGLL